MTAKTASLRTGLPEHLRLLADLYPRQGWEGHRNFDDLTRFWLDRHIMFRDLTTRLQKETEGFQEQPDDRFAPNLRRLTGFLMNQLHGHHSIEDHHYFPMLIPLDSRLKSGFELMESDHEDLVGHIHLLAEKTNLLVEAITLDQPAEQAADALIAAQTGFSQFLNRHLEDEEELVVPVILEYGHPEFD